VRFVFFLYFVSIFCFCIRSLLKWLDLPLKRNRWTNGVALWIGDTFGDSLQRPTCPPIVDSQGQLKRRDLRLMKDGGLLSDPDELLSFF
jgi:hypothetical protein